MLYEHDCHPLYLCDCVDENQNSVLSQNNSELTFSFNLCQIFCVSSTGDVILKKKDTFLTFTNLSSQVFCGTQGTGENWVYIDLNCQCNATSDIMQTKKGVMKATEKRYFPQTWEITDVFL